MSDGTLILTYCTHLFFFPVFNQVVKLFAEANHYAGELDTTSLFHYRQKDSKQGRTRSKIVPSF